MIKKKDLNDKKTGSDSFSADNGEMKKVFFQDYPILPENYNKNKIVFMVRDPNWGYVYWEISQESNNARNLGKKEKYLRVYDVTKSHNRMNPDSFFEIKINIEADNWYIKFPLPNRTYSVDLGYYDKDEYVALLKSNEISAPRNEVSDKTDIDWMIPDEDYERLLELSGADIMFEQIGSRELIKFLAGNEGQSEKESNGRISISISSPVGASFSK